MHELSIAGAVMEIVERNARGRRVARVELRVGHLRQVVPASLDFAWELVTQGTALDGAELSIEYVPARTRCRDCGEGSELESFPARCLACGSMDVDVDGGDELLVVALELDEEQELASTGG
jgi:hydrogenase nickel incorporation protein HypA/HybF